MSARGYGDPERARLKMAIWLAKRQPPAGWPMMVGRV
jgi:hypothetical protein